MVLKWTRPLLFVIVSYLFGVTSIIHDTPMQLLDLFIFSRLTDGQRIRQVCICTDTRGDNFSLLNIKWRHSICGQISVCISKV